MKRFALLGTLSLTLGLLLASSAPALMRAPRGDGHDAVHSGSRLRPVTYRHAKHRRANKLRRKALRGNRHALRVLSAPNTMCTAADDPNADAALQESAMGCLLNYARQQAGMSRLGDLQKLDGAADNKGADILRCNEFSHEACGRDFLYWIRRTGYLSGRCWWVGENLAWGTGKLGSARSVMKAWLHSPDHRANVLSTNYGQFGISLRVGSLSGASDAHVWVNHFGRRC